MAEAQEHPLPSTLLPCSGSDSDSSAIPSLPPPPIPAADPRVLDVAYSEDYAHSPTLAAQADNIFRVSPQAALRLLSAGIEALVNVTGDIPPTPPPRSPAVPHMRGMEAEKQSIVRSNSEKNLARLARQGSASNSPRPGRSPLQRPLSASGPAPLTMTPSADRPAPTRQPTQPIDGVHLRSSNHAPPHTPPSSSEQSPRRLVPYIVVGENSQPLNAQHSAITRKFYCRVPPPISITDYLLRIHNYCPMTTGVYLAASLYIHRLAVLERAIVVTKRNAHRLLLAGLRVAMKALEDMTYAQGRFAKVGGVTERELARLEISFCFLTSFELAVTPYSLSAHWELLRGGAEYWNVHVLDEAMHGGGGFVQLGKPPRGNSLRAQA